MNGLQSPLHEIGQNKGVVTVPPRGFLEIMTFLTHSDLFPSANKYIYIYIYILVGYLGIF